jgi:hypothetical protein
MLDYNSEAYARYEDSHPGFWNRIRGEKVMEFLNPEADDRILEIGCNTGWLVRKIMVHSKQDGWCGKSWFTQITLSE